MFSRQDIREGLQQKVADMMVDFSRLPHVQYKVIAGFKNKNIYTTDMDIKMNCLLDDKYRYSYYAGLIQKIVARINGDKSVFFVGLECGVSDAFYFPLQIGIDGRVSRYDPSQIESKIQHMYHINQITKGHYMQILDLLQSNPTVLKSVELCTLLQPYTLLTWSQKEVQTGIKRLPNGGQHFDLASELRKTRVTLKFIVDLQEGRYVDVELSLFFKTNLNNRRVINDLRFCCHSQNEASYDVYSIVKFIIRKRYLKVLKRIRSLYNVHLEHINHLHRDKRRAVRKNILDIAKDINQLCTDGKIGVLSQCTHQCRVMQDLLALKVLKPSDVRTWYLRMRQSFSQDKNQVWADFERTLQSKPIRRKMIVDSVNKILLYLEEKIHAQICPRIAEFYDRYTQVAGTILKFDLMALLPY